VGRGTLVTLQLPLLEETPVAVNVVRFAP
jgi:hypothetical protein